MMDAATLLERLAPNCVIGQLGLWVELTADGADFHDVGNSVIRAQAKAHWNDVGNASAIVLLLDALESKGFETALRSVGTEYVCQAAKSPFGTSQGGPTRLNAVLACALSVAESLGGTENG